MYIFRKHSRFSGDAEIVYKELEKIRKKNNGKLETTDVLKTAKNFKNPLNRYFEWNNTKAAEQFRLITARKIIKAVVYVEEKNDPQIPVFINVQSTSIDPYYQNVSVATRNEFDIAVEQLKTKIVGLSRDVKLIQHLANTPQQKKVAKQIHRKTTQFQKTI